MGEWKKTWCGYCGVTCGLEMEVEDNKIIRVRPDPDSPRSRGYCCRKGRSAKYQITHKDRLLYPQKRVGDHYERISWEQAYREIGEKGRKILDEHGPRSFAVLGGGTTSFQTPMGVIGPMMKAIGGQYVTCPVGVEFMGAWWSNGRIFGSQLHMLEPDDRNAEVIVYWGGNTYVTHQIINSRAICREFSENPDKMVIVVDPRLSETARMADMHIMPRNGSDALLLRGLIALILKNGWQDQKFINSYAADYAKILPWFSGVDIDECFRVCGVPRAQMEEFARILTKKRWGMHQDLGLYFGRHSTVDSYLCNLLMIICGMMFVKGGNIPLERVITVPCSDERDPKTWRMPVTGRFPVLGMFPEGAFPAEILGDNEDRIRFCISSLANPARGYPDSRAMEEALKKLELYVAIDYVETESTRLADYILPGMSVYEGDGDFNFFTLNYPEVVFAARRRVVRAPGEAKEDTQIFAELSQALGLLPELPESLYKAAEEAVRTGDRMTYFLKVAAWLAKTKMKYFDQAATVIALTLGKAYGSAARAISWGGMITSTLPKYVNMQAPINSKRHPILSRMPVLKDMCLMDDAFQLVEDHPEGAIIAYSDEDHLLERHIEHKDRKFHLWCQEIEDFLYRYITPEAEEKALTLKDGNNLIFSAGRHTDNGMNAQIRNPESFRFRQPYTLAMNPEQAQEMGFANGQMVRITTDTGSIVAPVEYSWQINRGYCMAPHHFGFTFEGKTYGEHVNMLTNHMDLDALTGNARWRYTPCRVEALKEGEHYEIVH